MKLFKKLSHAGNYARKILGINKRNLGFIYPNNQRKDYPLADDKLKTKTFLQPLGISVPKTLKAFRHFYELSELSAVLAGADDFVIKPAGGSQGSGILVILGKRGNSWLGANGVLYSEDDIKRHITNIIFGVFSMDLQDAAIIEERLILHDELIDLSPDGLADVRIIIHQQKIIIAMIRLPTKESEGKANLHQGAIGAGVDIKTGKINHAIIDNKSITQHPDSGVNLIGHSLPHWQKVIEMANQISAAVPLQYLGIDVAITQDEPVLVELNVRPGLQIQCANDMGLLSLLEDVK